MKKMSGEDGKKIDTHLSSYLEAYVILGYTGIYQDTENEGPFICKG